MSEQTTDAEHLVWSYSHTDGWTRIPDPAPGRPGEDGDKALDRAGFSELQTWPSTDATVFVQLYEGEDGGWLVAFSTTFTWHPVIVADLPSLLDVLAKMLPLVEAGARLDVLQDQNDAEREERRGAEEKEMQATSGESGWAAGEGRAAVWTGYRWLDGRWVVVCSRPGIGQCHRKLNTALREKPTVESARGADGWRRTDMDAPDQGVEPMTTSTQTAVAFTGWYRPHRGVPWTRLVCAATYDDAWGLLLDATRNTRGGESIVVRVDTDPNAPPRRRASQ